MLVTKMNNNNFNQNNPNCNSANLKQIPNLNATWWNNMSPNVQIMQQQQLQQQRQLLGRMPNLPQDMRADMNNNQNVMMLQQPQPQQQNMQQQFQVQQYLNFQQQHQNQQQHQQQQILTPNNCINANNNRISANTLVAMNYFNPSPRNIQQSQHHQIQQQQQHQQQQQLPTQQQQPNRAYLVATPTPTSQQQQQHSSPQTPTQLMQQATVAAPSPSPSVQHQRLALHSAQQRLVSVDGIQSGVPTLTTSTLTPTLLQSIEETFTQLIDGPEVVPFQATFIPPVYPSTSNTTNNVNSTLNGSIQASIDTESEDSLGPRVYEDYTVGGDTTENSSATTDSTSFQNGLYKNSLGNSNSNSASTNDFSSIGVAIAAATAEGVANAGKKNNSNINTSSSATTGSTRRNQGGRRPAKPSNLTPEEEEKRRIRRERNKEAAARCRKRRVDLTNDLLVEVSELEKRRDILQKDIASLNTQKQELEYILEAHRPTCQKIRQDLLSVTTFGGLIAPNGATTRNNDPSGTISGIDTTLASTGRSSPIDLKPEIIHDNLLGIPHIKNEPIDSTLDGSSLDRDGPPSPKRMLLSSNNPMVQSPLPKIGTLSPSLAAAASATLNTPTVTTAPVSFSTFGSMQNNSLVVNTLNAINRPHFNVAGGSKQRPTTLPTVPRNSVLGLNVDNKAPTDINGVAIQTPSTGVFNFDSLMDGGTGLTPVSGPLVPTCSSQNKHPLELTTPTSEPSKLVSL